MMNVPCSTNTFPLNLVHYEEALASVEDELDRQAAIERRNELLAKRRRCNEDDHPLIEERENQMNSVAEELDTLDRQVRAWCTRQSSASYVTFSFDRSNGMHCGTLKRIVPNIISLEWSPTLM